MKIAVMASLLAKRDVYIDAGQGLLRFI